MRIILIVLFSFVFNQLQAQTNEIAFKSHSGNMEFFKAVINKAGFDNEDGGFGLPVPTKIKSYKLDSVFYVSDTVSVIVIREYQRLEKEPIGSAKLVRVSKDTLYRDSLLGHRHSLDSIKSVLGKLGYYVNPVSDIVFIGYEEQPIKKEKTKNETFVPISFNDSSGNSPFDSKLYWMLGSILLLSVLGGWLSWKYYQPRFR